MNMNYMREFAVIAKSCSFSLAAEDLNMSQSSLSKHIQALESEIGFQLFDRTTRKTSLSELGKVLLPYAEQLYEIDEKIQSTIKNQQMKSRSNVRVLSIPVMAHYNITGVMALFQKQNPNINLLFSECSAYQIDRCLMQNDCDFALTRKSSGNNPTLDIMNIFEEYLAAVVHRSHPFSTETQISVSVLANENFLFLDKASLLYDQCYALCKEAGFIPNVAYAGHNIENLIDFVAQGMGVAILPRRQAEYFHNREVVCVDITPSIKSSICLIKTKNKQMSSAAHKFWTFIQNEYMEKKY